MIDSPTTQFFDVKVLLRKTSTTSYIKLEDEEAIAKKTCAIIHGSSIYSYFIRISLTRKLSFLKNMAQRMTIESIALILQTLHPTLGKISAYLATSTKESIPYDKVINDHDRMYGEDFFEETVPYDLEWFKKQKDNEQVALFIGLFRLSGGGIMHQLYKYLKDLHARRPWESAAKPNTKQSKEEVKTHLPPKEEKESTSCPLFPEFAHDPKDPNHIECLKATKKWETTIAKYRKEVETMEKSKTEIKGKKKKGKGKKKSKGKTDSSNDWIQIMPIGIVKKIFSYLDKKTLAKAKKVNEYWKWVVGDLLKDLKVKKLLDKTRKKITADLMGSSKGCSLPVDSSLIEEKPRVSWTDRRFRKLHQRGAILDKFRYITTGPLEQHCLIKRALECISFNVDHIDEVTMLPRVKRSNPPLYQIPDYILKDYEVIYDEKHNAMSVHEMHGVLRDLSSIFSSMNSEEMEY